MSILSSLFNLGSGARSVSASEAATLVAQGRAVLVDVRTPEEWAETGVAEPALLISMQEMKGEAGRKLLEEHKDKELLFYCHSGARSGMVARAVAGQGVRAGNVGGLDDWIAAGLPLRKV